MCSFPFSSFSKCLSHELHYLNRDLLVFREQLAPQETQVKKDREGTQEREENLENRFVHNVHYLQCHHPQNVCCQGNKGGTLARVLTSHQCCLDLNPGVDLTSFCGLSFLFFSLLCPERFFLQVPWFSPLLKKQIPVWPGIVDKESLSWRATFKSFFICYFICFIEVLFKRISSSLLCCL